MTPKEILQANESKPTGFMIDLRTPTGKRYMRFRESSVSELKAKLGDLIDPEVFYEKHALIIAAAAL